MPDFTLFREVFLPSATEESPAVGLSGRDGQTEVTRSGGESIVEGCDRRTVLLRGVQNTAVRHLQLRRSAQFDLQLREKLLKSIRPSGPGGAGVDLGESDDTGSERLQHVGFE